MTEDIEVVAYIAAINTELSERGKPIIKEGSEEEMVKSMLRSQTNYHGLCGCLDRKAGARGERFFVK